MKLSNNSDNPSNAHFLDVIEKSWEDAATENDKAKAEVIKCEIECPCKITRAVT